MHSVLLLIVSFAALAGLYIQLDAPFAAVIQIVIYAGAIMVLFVFVVMLLNAHREDEVAAASRAGRCARAWSSAPCWRPNWSGPSCAHAAAASSAADQGTGADAATLSRRWPNSAACSSPTTRWPSKSRPS